MDRKKYVDQNKPTNGNLQNTEGIRQNLILSSVFQRNLKKFIWSLSEVYHCQNNCFIADVIRHVITSARHHTPKTKLWGGKNCSPDSMWKVVKVSTLADEQEGFVARQFSTCIYICTIYKNFKPGQREDALAPNNTQMTIDCWVHVKFNLNHVNLNEATLTVIE